MQKERSSGLFWFATFTALATFVLLGIGGLVTSHEAGMAVPDWPTSYGYNMFALPFAQWVGGVFYEHSHRIVASFVGVLTVLLMRWVGGHPSRKPLAIIGIIEVGAGLMLPILSPGLRNTGHFLAGIGGVVLLGALVWSKNPPALKPLPLLGWIAFVTVQLQGLLGGLRVVLYNDEIGIFHAGLAQIFFVNICLMALMASSFWKFRQVAPPDLKLTRWVWICSGLIFCQLMIGATMRHEHAGLAIRDFPAAYGRFWPDTSPAAIQSYNQNRGENVSVKPITATHIHVHMIHRFAAYGILVLTAITAWVSIKRHGAKSTWGKLSLILLAMVIAQASLGAATVLTNKAADFATLHLLLGALTLAFGAIMCIILFRSLVLVGYASKATAGRGDPDLGNSSIAAGMI